ncbi:MAG TPA: excinuclease ABC subunit UvrC [Planctomycetota bacterium]|nr:excinuclease ABC subunit UvrC [Planctomycetota bacterium]
MEREESGRKELNKRVRESAAALPEPPSRDELEAKIAQLPQAPGVYELLDERHKVIYVGKAKNLRSRVRSYLNNPDDGRMFYPVLVRHLRDVSVTATHTDKEALLLENTLIKRHRPRFNVKLVDDKTFLSIEITTDEPFPRARLVRRPRRGKGIVFGPYASASSVRETLRLIKRWFPLRTCSNAELRNRTRPCIEHQMGRCGAPCVGLQTPEDYAKVVDDVVLFLKGKDDTLLPRLKERMNDFAQKLQYEQAARLRDQIEAIEGTLERQRVARSAGDRDQDFFGIATKHGAAVVYVLSVRDGRIVQNRAYTLRSSLEEREVLNAFLGQYYSPERMPPLEVLLPFEVEDQEVLGEILSERRLAKVQMKASVRGDRADLLELAKKNAELALETGVERREATEAMLEGLKKALDLPKVPRSIECFDISTIQGFANVASLVRFEDGEPVKSRYRKFKIKTVTGQDDFAAMREVLRRRLRRGLTEGELPDLVVIDGGKGQLSQATTVASELGVQGVSFVGLAKARSGEEGLRAFERVFSPGKSDPVVLPPDSSEVKYLARIRDEAHRFAITYHRELRRKRAFKAGLDEVAGVGPKRRRELFEKFRNLKGLKAASVDELATVVPKEVALRLFEYLNGDEGRMATEDTESTEKDTE